MPSVNQRPPDRRLFTSPLLTEVTSSIQDHPCRVCRENIIAGTPCRFRAWHIEYSHEACGWLLPEEYEPHVRRKPGSFVDYWEWRCPRCNLDSCSMRKPDDETILECSRCEPTKHDVTDRCRVELVTSITVGKIGSGRATHVARGSRGRVLELGSFPAKGGESAHVEWIGARAPSVWLPINMLVRV